MIRGRLRAVAAAMVAGSIALVLGWTVRADGPPLAGDMAKFVPADPPAPTPDLSFSYAAGNTVSLGDFAGKVVLVNLWATWCAPCVEEIPSLDALQAELGGDDFEVVALSLDRGGLDQVRPFYEDHDIANLSIYLDPSGASMRALSVRGLPTTVLVDADGRMVGRLEGAADWAGADAEALIAHYRP